MLRLVSEKALILYSRLIVVKVVVGYRLLPEVSHCIPTTSTLALDGIKWVRWVLFRLSSWLRGVMTLPPVPCL